MKLKTELDNPDRPMMVSNLPTWNTTVRILLSVTFDLDTYTFMQTYCIFFRIVLSTVEGTTFF